MIMTTMVMMTNVMVMITIVKMLGDTECDDNRGDDFE